VFRSRLGLTANDAELLRRTLLDAARDRQDDLQPTDVLRLLRLDFNI
jgi:hypothetical protein